jgi:hypothetical protein
LVELTQAGKLFEDPILPNTLLVPAVPCYPVMDFAFFAENQTIYIFQLTLGEINSKIPNEPNLLDPKWKLNAYPYLVT